MKKLVLIITLVILSTVCFSQDKIKLANEQIKSEIVSLKKIIEKIDWVFDYYFVIWLYSPRKIDRYSKYMEDKWGKKMFKHTS